jgi:hypothetical protein
MELVKVVTGPAIVASSLAESPSIFIMYYYWAHHGIKRLIVGFHQTAVY